MLLWNIFCLFLNRIYFIFSCLGKQSIIGKSSKRFEKNLRKNARRNQLLQHRKKKREQVLAQKRNLGGFFSAPILICVIPLQNDIDIKDIVFVVTNMDETANVATSSNGIIHIRYTVDEGICFLILLYSLNNKFIH